MAGVTIGGTLAVLSLFQNCSAQDYSNTLASSSKPPIAADSIPFAFDYKPDMISYMSCSRSDDFKDNKYASVSHLSDPEVFYTFKAGSHASGGLKIREEFIEHVQNNITYQGTLSEADLDYAFTDAPVHAGAGIQLSARDVTRVTTKITDPMATSGEPQTGIDFGLFPKNRHLTSTEFLTQLRYLFYNPSIRVNKLGTNSLQGYSLMSSFHKGLVASYNEPRAQAFRDKMSETTGTSRNLLTVTFSKDLRNPENSGRPYIARGLSSNTTEEAAWGYGYQLGFSAGQTGKKANVLGFEDSTKYNEGSIIEEWDLRSFEPTGSYFICPASMRFMIVSPVDAATVCPETESTPWNSAEKANLARAQLHLPNWVINPRKWCAYPKKVGADCYGTRAFREVAYSESETSCGYNPTTGAYLDKACPEFVSFCYRP